MPLRVSVGHCAVCACPIHRNNLRKSSVSEHACYYCFLSGLSLQMGALDFTEIPGAASGASRDSFELFAREFLVEAGYEVAAGPDQGADGGRDLIVIEKRMGPGGLTQIHWLVSCKHYAHGGKSVTPGDEGNIRDRLETHSCNGFMPFYSTLPSSGLGPILDALKSTYEVIFYDPEHIEWLLLDSPRGRGVAARFMPASFNAWIRNSQHVQASFFPIRSSLGMRSFCGSLIRI